MPLNGSLVNSDGSHYSGDKFSSILDGFAQNIISNSNEIF